MKQVKVIEGYVDEAEEKINDFLATISNTNIVSIDWKPKTQRDGIYCVIVYNSYKTEFKEDSDEPWNSIPTDNNDYIVSNLPEFKNPPPAPKKKDIPNCPTYIPKSPTFPPDRIEDTWPGLIPTLSKLLKNAWAWISTTIKRGISWLS